MMIDQAAFIERLDRAKSLGLKAKAAIAEGIRTNRFEGQEVFLSPGNFANAIYFIQHGLIRGAIEGREGKLSTWFKQEGDLILPQGIFNQKPSEEYISAINRTVVSVLPLKHLRKVAESFPEVYELIIAMLSEYLKDGQYRENYCGSLRQRTGTSICP